MQLRVRIPATEQVGGCCVKNAMLKQQKINSSVDLSAPTIMRPTVRIPEYNINAFWKNIKKDQRQRTYIKVASVSNLILSNNLLQNQIFKKVKATMHAQKDSSCLCRILGNWYHKMSGYLSSIFTIQHQLICSLSKLEKLDFCDLVAITIIIYLQTQNCLQDDIQILLHAWNTLV